MFKYALLGIIAERPRHGYDLKAAFEAAFGGTWPVNEGQVYTTLSRLDRDGLVTIEVVEQEGLPDRKVYRITELGRKDLRTWLEAPTPLSPPLRDELFVKVLVHRLLDSDGLAGTVAGARQDLLTALRSLGDRRDAEPPGSVTAALLDAAIGQLDATARWLDGIER